jgi:hypothetical protein
MLMCLIASILTDASKSYIAFVPDRPLYMARKHAQT